MALPPEGLATYLTSTGFDAVTLLEVDELAPQERMNLPAWSIDALTEEGPDGIVAATAHWQRVLPGTLDDTIELFRRNAAALCVGREPEEWGGHLVLIYVLRGAARPFVCWYGYPPTDHLDNRMMAFRPGMKTDLTQVPHALRTFYTQLHNRFRIVGWGECGLPPLDEMFTLDGEVSDYEYEGTGDHQPAPDRLLPIFNSSNGRLCVELGTENTWKQNAELLEPQGQLWPTLNQWIGQFTDEMANYPDH